MTKRLLTICCLFSLVNSGSPIGAFGQETRHLFEQYGAIKWEDERALLDNFAIQVLRDPNLIGYILVFDDIGGCPGEAQARAIRAKRYLMEIRNVPSDRVIWRTEGFSDGISTILQPAPRVMVIPYQDLGVVRVGRSGPPTKACRNKLRRIKRW
ncbi:MAG TPA: hypothetical protein VL866_11350 [Pyrinomonadaceae bacterium]|nr:hypothetical protein [Pyrinomonadaceae bacterium]